MSNPLPLKSIHHVELLVGNAKQAAFYYRKAFGFSQVAYAGPETGVRNQASYVLQQGRILLVLSTPLTPEDPMSEHHRIHGDGVLDIAFLVDDVDATFQEAVDRGGQIAKEPYDVEDEYGRIRRAKLRAYGDTLHSLISLTDYRGVFLPGYKLRRIPEPSAGLLAIDHVVGNVEDGKMNEWVELLQPHLRVQPVPVVRRQRHLDRILRPAEQGDGQHDGGRQVPDQRTRAGPAEEPDSGIPRVQPRPRRAASRAVDERHHPHRRRPAGRRRRVSADSGEILRNVWDRVGEIREDKETIEDLGILIDRDEKGYLLQLFTRPVEDRPTLFYEIIQRRGSDSFGKGNFRSLFEAIEQEQAARGNL